TTRELVRKLARARSQEIALRRGTVKTVAAEGPLIAFLREPEAGDPGRPVLCVLNSAERDMEIEVAVPGTRAIDLLEDGSALAVEGGKLRVSVPAATGKLFAL